MCEQCWSGMTGGGLSWCEDCGLVRYCGEVCRMRGWEEHRRECEAVGQEGAGGRVLNDILRERLQSQTELSIILLLQVGSSGLA